MIKPTFYFAVLIVFFKFNFEIYAVCLLVQRRNGTMGAWSQKSKGILGAAL